MLTRKQTEKAPLQSKKKAAEAALKMQMEKGKLKRLEEKKTRDAERKQEEELRKKGEAEQRKLQASTVAESMVVSSPTQMEEDMADPSINSHLSDMMQGSHLLDMMQGGSKEDAAGDEEEQRSPAKSKQKKITFAEATASKLVLKPRIKPPKPVFEAHNHTNADYCRGFHQTYRLSSSARLHCEPSRTPNEWSDGG